MKAVLKTPLEELGNLHAQMISLFKLAPNDTTNRVAEELIRALGAFRDEHPELAGKRGTANWEVDIMNSFPDADPDNKE